MKINRSLIFIVTLPLLGGCGPINEVNRDFVIAERDIVSSSCLTYREYENGYEVSFDKTTHVTKVVIPATYKDKEVIRIADDCFSDCLTISMIHLPNTIASIGKNAFKGSQIKMVNIPLNVKSIEEDAFSQLFNASIMFEAPSLKGLYEGKIDITNLIDFEVIDYVFNDDYVIAIKSEVAKLTKVLSNKANYVIPKTINYYEKEYHVDMIGRRSFLNAALKLENIEFNNFVKLIDTEAFIKCSKIKDIYLPMSLRFVDSRAFKDCPNLTIHIPTNLKENHWASDWNIDNNPVVWEEVEEA